MLNFDVILCSGMNCSVLLSYLRGGWRLTRQVREPTTFRDSENGTCVLLADGNASFCEWPAAVSNANCLLQRELYLVRQLQHLSNLDSRAWRQQLLCPTADSLVHVYFVEPLQSSVMVLDDIRQPDVPLEKPNDWFKVGTLFHALHLSGEHLFATPLHAEHHCNQDLYKVTYRFIDDLHFIVSYDVTGPHKNYCMTTKYFRIA